MPLRAILFDLDETLIPEDEPLFAAYLAVAGSAEAVAPLRERVRALWRREAPCPEYRASTQVGASDGLSADFDGDHPALAAIREFLPRYRATALERPELVEVWRTARWRAQGVFPGAHELLQDLRARYRLGLVTNGPSEQQRRKIALTGVGRYFDAVVASCDIGAGKPDPAIFHAALAKLGVAASEALMVGNDAERDLAGAAAAGIEAVLVRDGVFAPLARYSRTTQLSRRA